MSLPQFVQGCMGSKGYSVLHGTDSCYSIPPIDGIGRKYPTREACLRSDNAYLPTGATYFPTPWQNTVPPVAYDSTAPGPKLLLLAKKLADSGQTGDPSAVAAILQLPLILSERDESGPVSCAAAPDQVETTSDSYAAKERSWFRALPSGTNLRVNPDRNDWIPFGGGPVTPQYVSLGNPVFSYTISSSKSCGGASPRDGIDAEIVFNNIPAYACISDQLARTIFPPGPLNELGRTIDGPGPDLAYFVKDTRVMFDLTWPAGERPDPAGQPDCLQTIAIGTHYALGTLNEAAFTGKHPMPNNVPVPPNAPNARRPGTTPGAYLLERVKALADSANITDPVAASAILHMPFVLANYTDNAASCAAFPDSKSLVSDGYVTTKESWFRAMPTGTRLLFVSPVYAKDYTTVIGHTTFPLDPPSFGYGTDAHESCTPSPGDNIDFGISFANIPSYACISAQQIKANFPGLHVPTGAEVVGMRPDFTYISAHSWVQFFMAANPWAVMGPHKLAPRQPDCLTLIQIYALLDLAEQKREFTQMQAARKDNPPPPP